jgi:hypothetical protein
MESPPPPPNGDDSNNPPKPTSSSSSSSSAAAGADPQQTVDVFGDMQDQPIVLLFFVIGLMAYFFREQTCTC